MDEFQDAMKKVTKQIMERELTHMMDNGMKRIVEYILETELDNYVEYCLENGYELDDAKVMDEHVFGLACTAMGTKPSEVIG